MSITSTLVRRETEAQSSKILDRSLVARMLITRGEADTTLGTFNINTEFGFTCNDTSKIKNNERWKELQTIWEETILIPLSESINRFLKENEDVFMMEHRSYSRTCDLEDYTHERKLKELMEELS